MRTDFIPLLFGGDINVYSMARAFHEAYGVTSIAFGKFATGPCFESAIIDYRVCPENEREDVFFQNVCQVAGAHPDQTVLLVGCGDSYVRLAAQCRDRLPENVIAPYVGPEQMEQLTDKEQFYALCDQHGIAHPATVVHRRQMGRAFDLPFPGPYICKPSDGVAYWAHPFPGNEKVFLLETRAQLEDVLERVYAAGYPGSMIIQEFIPGDDSYMHVLTCYSGREAAVQLMCLGHVLLEEHTPHGIGNHAVIVTERNDDLCAGIQRFLEAVSFTGFSNFDIKYDRRDGTYKVFELNARQGRSNYYVTGAGYNLAQLLVEDRIDHKPAQLCIGDAPSLWRVVPRKVALDYTPAQYHKQMKRLVDQGAAVNPLFYGPDSALKRRLRLEKNQLGHFLKFPKYYKKPGG